MHNFLGLLIFCCQSVATHTYKKLLSKCNIFMLNESFVPLSENPPFIIALSFSEHHLFRFRIYVYPYEDYSID